jgi:hypothetical protein
VQQEPFALLPWPADRFCAAKCAMSMLGLLVGGLKVCRERARVGFQLGWAITCVRTHAPNRICTSDAFGRDRRHRHSTRNAFSAPITTCGGNVRAVSENTQVKTCSECLLARAVLSSNAARSFQLTQDCTLNYLLGESTENSGHSRSTSTGHSRPVSQPLPIPPGAPPECLTEPVCLFT